MLYRVTDTSRNTNDSSDILVYRIDGIVTLKVLSNTAQTLVAF